MRVKEEARGDVRILRLSGEFDAVDLPDLAARLDAAGGARRVVLDLRDVRFATVGLVGCVLGARAKARGSGGDLVLGPSSRFVGRVLRALGLERELATCRVDGVPDITRSGSLRVPCPLT